MLVESKNDIPEIQTEMILFSFQKKMETNSDILGSLITDSLEYAAIYSAILNLCLFSLLNVAVLL